ncbi:MAG: SDR family NAD(P)-dependent oxidoreductase [Clostridium sp.]
MKKILITGAGTGLGKAASIELAKRGHFVYATTHTIAQADKLNKLSLKENLPLKSFKLDLLNEMDRELASMLDLDVLINNAAIGDSGSVSETNVDRYRATFETNVFSPLELTQQVLKNMIAKGSGRIIYISSLAGRISIPFLSPYCSTKFAIEAIASSLREEMKELPKGKINVVIIEPGAYATGFNFKNISKQFTWMDERSYFYGKIEKLKRKQYRYFNLVEKKNLDSIVREYVKAVEDKNPKERYVAPCIQGSFIQGKRIFGK